MSENQPPTPPEPGQGPPPQPYQQPAQQPYQQPAQQPYAPQYQQPAQPSGPITAPPGTDFPGKTLGIVGLVLSFFTTLIGFIISIVAFRQSKKAGYKNTPALVGIIIGAIATAVAIIVTIVLVAVLGGLAAQCAQLGPGVHEVNGTTVRCG